jgi:2'-5' RNA ligase
LSAIRAFLALTLDAPAHRRLLDLVESLRPRVGGIRWVRPEGLHLTLRFLGWTDDETLQRFADDVARAAAACAPGRGPLGPLGMFPERGAPRVLWVRLGCPPGLLALQAAGEAAAVRAGFPPEERAFAPHVTLGRWKDRAPRPVLPEVQLGETVLDRVVLFLSELRREGAVYTPLRTFPLGG